LNSSLWCLNNFQMETFSCWTLFFVPEIYDRIVHSHLPADLVFRFGKQLNEIMKHSGHAFGWIKSCKMLCCVVRSVWMMIRDICRWNIFDRRKDNSFCLNTSQLTTKLISLPICLCQPLRPLSCLEVFTPEMYLLTSHEMNVSEKVICFS